VPERAGQVERERAEELVLRLPADRLVTASRAALLRVQRGPFAHYNRHRVGNRRCALFRGVSLARRCQRFARVQLRAGD
jgi:hypothetical protein